VAQAADSLPKGFDEYIGQVVRDWKVPGLAIAVVKGDAVGFAKGYGVRKLGESAPVDERTLFAIGSCSKAFTATALAMLVDDGKISWDDPVIKHLRDFQLSDPYATREITVRDLLCHRSGLARHDFLWYGASISREEVICRLRHARMSTSFRSQFGYQNIMYVAAGQIISAVTGQSWDDFVKQRIFTPLEMTDSNTTTTVLGHAANVATTHEKIEDKVEAVLYRNIDNVGPAGSINSSVADMAQWMRFQLKGGVYKGERLLTSKAIKETQTPQTVIRTEGMGREGLFWALAHPESRLLVYGLGWVLREYRGRVVVQHGGAVDGMCSAVALIPEEKLGVVIMSNLGRHLLPYALVCRVFDAYLKAKPRDWSAELLKVHEGLEKQQKEAEERIEKERVQGTKPSLALEKYAGTYQDDLYGEIKVIREKDKLVVHYGPSLIGDLEHWHHDIFRATWTDRAILKALVTFRLNERSEADEIRIASPHWDEELSAQRMPPPSDTTPAITDPSYHSGARRAAPVRRHLRSGGITGRGERGTAPR
jgi:CubicO group peptidase (beta-lactamase class C family)